jgi:hypothetical protein
MIIILIHVSCFLSYVDSILKNNNNYSNDMIIKKQKGGTVGEEEWELAGDGEGDGNEYG